MPLLTPSRRPPHAAAAAARLLQINSGHVAEAETILDKVIASSPKELGARVARGTARALRRDLQGGCSGEMWGAEAWVEGWW
jgi:hypothetical protein